ncbi:MAG: hypothetical protein ACRDRJ_04225 [Streptosporangiaceae bacterium]
MLHHSKQLREWATVSGILRDAAAGKGNFGLGEATEEVAAAGHST